VIERVAGFDWDEGNRAKCARHGVSIDDVEGLFRREVWVFPDPARSTRETRFLGIGRTVAGRHVFVAFTYRVRDGERWLRPISARFMHAKEVRHYEEEVARRQE
jgi:uncharacterized DUF497 family protein